MDDIKNNLAKFYAAARYGHIRNERIDGEKNQ